MSLSRRRFVYSAALGLMVPTTLKASTPLPFSFFKSGVTLNSWGRLVISFGGPTPSANSMAAIDAFFAGLATAGIQSKMLSVNVIAPDSLVAACVPMINTFGNQLWTNNNFVGTDLTVNGLKGDGSTKYLDTGFVPGVSTARPDQNFGMTIVSPDSASNSGTECEFGSVNTSASNNNTALFLNLAGDTYAESCGFGSGFNIQVHPQPGNGYYSANRVSTTDLKLYFANQATPHAQVGSATTATSPCLSTTTFAFAVRDAFTNAAAFFSAKRLSCIGIHQGLTSSESASFYSLIATLRNSLGGGNP